MSCTCDNCHRQYKVDVIVDDVLWKKINPSDMPEGGLLCGPCICEKIEALNTYDAYNLVTVE